jgi:hypothetical protein
MMTLDAACVSGTGSFASKSLIATAQTSPHKNVPELGAAALYVKLAKLHCPLLNGRNAT